MDILESSENYLETIYYLHRTLGNVRSVDIARELNYSKPSITKAMAKLKALELIVIDKDGVIVFTKTGAEYALKIVKRHSIIKKILLSFGISEKNADADACKMEHIISQESLDAFELALNKKQ